MSKHFVKYGYFDDPSQKEPEYDPGVDDVACPVCHRPLNDEPIQTVSLLLVDEDVVKHDVRCLFYRIHRDCNHGDAADSIESRLVDQRMVELGQLTLDEFNARYD